MSQSTETATPAGEHGWLEHFPISFFAVVMGLSGLALATMRLEHCVEATDLTAGRVLTLLAAGAFVLIALVYATKLARHAHQVHWEWNHPVRISFFPAISIGLVLVGTALARFQPDVAIVVWGIGVALHLLATLTVVAAWIGHRPFQHLHLNPAWFIPAVGNVLVPIGGMHFGLVELSWFFFSVGILFWLILLTLVFNRLVFHDPLPERLLPTLVILIAPPAVGFVSWAALTGGLDAFGRILFYAAVIFALVVATQLRRLSRLPFTMSWWAYSFPVAAFTVASFRYAELTGVDTFCWVGFAAYGVLAAVIGLLTVQTIARRHEICQPE
ncbi:MAG: SLAC1 anion channel family protein [Rhodospirillaceae bacterium]|nr:SLAC1 anion channel family protein [Rhodospirillaceae bacterium]MCA8933844.1 SLAC1 anion channel family protein [Rhodospirillaceae bacterium]